MQTHFAAAAILLFSAILPVGAQNDALRIFENQTDVGATAHTGSVEHNAAQGAYLVAGGGENMWFTNDAFHFIWKKVSGDVTLAADISFLGSGGNAHRKACLLVR